MKEGNMILILKGASERIYKNIVAINGFPDGIHFTMSNGIIQTWKGNYEIKEAGKSPEAEQKNVN